MKILVISAHPDLSASVTNDCLLNQISSQPDITIHHLYETYPDWQIDVGYEQKLLSAHDRIVFQFPLYWYSSPPLLKKWQDEVLTYGWAYGRVATGLRGKELMVAVSIGGSRDAYRAGGLNSFTLDELLRPFQATASICGMTYLPLYCTEGRLSETELKESAAGYPVHLRQQFEQRL